MSSVIDLKDDSLPIQLKYVIERHVSDQLVKFASFLGIANIAALIGIYFAVTSFVAERAAESAAATAMDHTQKQMAVTTEQLNNLTTASLEKAINASVASLNAEQQATQAIKSIETIKGLNLDDVNDFLMLFQKSENEVNTAINLDERIRVLNAEMVSLSSAVEDNRADINGAYERIEALSKQNKSFSNFSIHNTNVRAEFERVSIIGGVSKTPNDGTGIATITFETEFEEPPYVVSTIYNNGVNYDGHPVVFDVNKRGFKVKVLRYEQKALSSDVQYKANAIFSYLAFGAISAE